MSRGIGAMAGGGQRGLRPGGPGAWPGSGCIRSRAGTGGCSRRSGSGPSSRRSAAWRPGIASGSRGSTPESSSGSSPPSEPGRPVELVLRIDERLRPLVRTDAVARIVSEGLVGAKVVELTPGRPDAPPVAELDRIVSERPIEIADLLKQGRRLAGERLETPDPVRRARARRDQRHRRLDPPRRGQPRQARPR